MNQHISRHPRQSTLSERRTPAQRAGATASQWLIVCIAVSLVVVPIALTETPREIARWHAAAADESRLSGRSEVALKQLATALTWDPVNLELRLDRARLAVAQRQWQVALEESREVRRRDPEFAAVSPLYIAALQHLGHDDLALREAQRFVRRNATSRPDIQAEALNTLAYTRAVADRDVQAGLKNIQRAIEMIGGQTATLDPQGFLWYGRAVSAQRNEDTSLALTCFDRAAQSAEERYEQNHQRALALAIVQPLALQYARHAAIMRAQLSGVLYQRAELLDVLGRTDEAKRDRDRYEELNQDGNASMIVPVTLATAMATLEEHAMYLDTRGFIRYRLKQFRQARADLDLAIRIADIVDQAFDWLREAQRHFILDIRTLQREQQQWHLSVAALLYHRMLVLKADGRDRLADADRHRIKQLGYEPTADLN